jgi:hypothetical protein
VGEDAGVDVQANQKDPLTSRPDMVGWLMVQQMKIQHPPNLVKSAPLLGA